MLRGKENHNLFGISQNSGRSTAQMQYNHQLCDEIDSSSYQDVIDRS